MPHDFEIRSTGTADYLSLPALRQAAAVEHGFTIKGSGSKNGPKHDLLTSERSRRLFMEQLGLPPYGPAMVKQVHGDCVLTVTVESDSHSLFRATAADAIITDVRGLALGLLTADCLPLILVDKEAGAVGIAHAGRKGTFLGIASKTVEAMQSAFGARPGSMLAALGPAIGPCCYQVGQDVAGPFKESFRWGEDVFQSSGGGKSYFDIFKANRIQLNQAGVDDDRIIAPGLCTSCLSSMFYSYRRDGGIKGNIFSFVMLEA